MAEVVWFPTTGRVVVISGASVVSGTGGGKSSNKKNNTFKFKTLWKVVLPKEMVKCLFT